MISKKQCQDVAQLLEQAQDILIIQADNPDGDSLGTALALEELLEHQGKKVHLYCGSDMPSYLRYIAGWDRVQQEVPRTFDMSIVVDASTKTLLQHLEKSEQLAWVATKPCLVIDHHTSVLNEIDFAQLSIIDSDYASTGDIVYNIARQLDWEITLPAAEFIMISILGDTQGLSNSLASANTYRTMADLIDIGVDRPALEEKRRASSKMAEEIFRYKATLIERTEFSFDNKIACVTIPPQEIKSFSPLYNPAPLIQSDILQTENVFMAIVFKYYVDGRVTGSIRCNSDAPIADKLAEQFGGGGHPFAAGFRVEDGRPVDAIKQQCLEEAAKLMEQYTA